MPGKPEAPQLLPIVGPRSMSITRPMPGPAEMPDSVPAPCWAASQGCLRLREPHFVTPGKPTDNGLIESFNGRLRHEFLNTHEFVTMHDLREKLKAWKAD